MVWESSRGQDFFLNTTATSIVSLDAIKKIVLQGTANSNKYFNNVFNKVNKAMSVWGSLQTWLNKYFYIYKSYIDWLWTTIFYYKLNIPY